jgi:hypothetical protein
MSRPPTADAVRRTRVAAQLLSGPPVRSAEQAAEQLLAVQAQNLRAARLAVRARSRGLTAASVNRELEDGTIVISWLCRGTLHLVARDDLPWLHGLTAPTQLVGNRRRLEQEGVGASASERAVRLVAARLADGPATRAELAERLAARGIVTDGQAMVHILFLATLRGLIVRGPFRGAEQAWVLTDDWLGARPPTSLRGERRACALAELARRYLRGHGPASIADLSLWAGLPQRDARAALEAISAELREWSGGRVDPASRRAVRRAPQPRLIPAFDAFLVGWSDRTFAVPQEHVGRVRAGGMINPTALVNGIGVGTWAAPRAGGRVDVRIDLWDELDADDRAALAAEEADVRRFESSR